MLQRDHHSARAAYDAGGDSVGRPRTRSLSLLALLSLLAVLEEEEAIRSAGRVLGLSLFVSAFVLLY